MRITTIKHLTHRNPIKRYHSSQCDTLTEIPKFLVGKDITGAFEYQKGDQQQWHTNYPVNGVPTARCYLVYSETGDSGMRFILNGKVYTSYDKVGWCYRIFNVPQPHCVFANCHRVSFGFRLPEVSFSEQVLNAKELPNAEAILHVT